MTLPSPASNLVYRFIYFDVRGAGELCRYTLAVSGFEWKDLRYPMKVAAQGFSYGPEFRRHVEQGAFAGNFNKLPLLQVMDPQLSAQAALVTLGQSHAIARFIAKQHKTLMGGESIFQQAKVDAIYESCRDIKSSWYRTKQQAEGKQIWFDSSSNSGIGDKPVSLKDHLNLLERALDMYGSKSPEPWCTGGSMPTLADIAIYDMLGTPSSPVSGSTCSFFDGERDGVLQALKELPRLKASVEACSRLDSVQGWEATRPDTFT